MCMRPKGSDSAPVIMSSMTLSPMRAPQRCAGAMYGARLMLSAPAPTAISASPSMMVCAAETMACRPEPHRRLTLKAGVSLAMPALMAATRDRYMSRGSVLMTWPTATWPTSSPLTAARSSAALMTVAPRSQGGTS